MRQVFIILGPPAAGKTSYRKAIARWLNIQKRYHVAWYVRTNGKHKFDIQERRGSFIKGVTGPFLNFVKKHSNGASCIIDGFPRNLGQAKAILKHFKAEELVLIHINVEVEDLKNWSYQRQLRRTLRRHEKPDQKLYLAKINRYLRYELSAICHLEANLNPSQIITINSNQAISESYRQLRLALGLPEEITGRDVSEETDTNLTIKPTETFTTEALLPVGP
ncbi:MAG: hypothetical protein R2880_12935 [Deinococcales bacterium]